MYFCETAKQRKGSDSLHADRPNISQFAANRHSVDTPKDQQSTSILHLVLSSLFCSNTLYRRSTWTLQLPPVHLLVMGPVTGRKYREDVQSNDFDQDTSEDFEHVLNLKHRSGTSLQGGPHHARKLESTTKKGSVHHARARAQHGADSLAAGHSRSAANIIREALLNIIKPDQHARVQGSPQAREQEHQHARGTKSTTWRGYQHPRPRLHQQQPPKIDMILIGITLTAPLIAKQERDQEPGERISMVTDCR